MTTLEALRRAERWRIKTGKLASSETDGFNGNFLVPLDGELWHIILSDIKGWRMLSVTNAQNKRFPEWITLCHLKDAFFADSDYAIVFVGPATKRQQRIELWQPLDEALILPLPWSASL
jgi:hypothetical protein